MTQKFPYLKHDFKTNLSAVKEWKLFDGDQGCTRVDHEGACLRMDRPPPARPTSAVQSAPQGPVLVEAGKQIKGWFKSTPAAPPIPLAPKEPEGPLLVEAWKEIQGWGKFSTNAKGKPVAPVFDIQDIPYGMDRLHWPKSAAIMRQFFAGKQNYSLNQDDESKGVNQFNEYYASEFVETKRFPWNWLLGYGAVQRAYELLTSPESSRLEHNMYNRAAYKELAKAISPSANARFVGELDALDECGGDVFKLHRKFQFQSAPVSMATFINTDLGGSLGNFSLYEVDPEFGTGV